MDANHRAEGHRLTLVFILIVAVLAALYRVVPYYLPGMARIYPWNLVPVGALALFAGSRWRSRWALLVPIGVMFVSDLLLMPAMFGLGYSSFGWGRPIIYASFAVYVLLGRLIRSGELAPAVIGGAALLGGLQFFVVSNFATWLQGTMYPYTVEGLTACYVAGIPFYRNTVLGDLIFSGLIFGLHAALVWRLGDAKARQPRWSPPA